MVSLQVRFLMASVDEMVFTIPYEKTEKADWSQENLGWERVTCVLCKDSIFIAEVK